MHTGQSNHALRLGALLVLLALSGLGVLAWQGGTAPAAAQQVKGSGSEPLDGSEALPPGTSIQTVIPSMDQPVALAFDPAGRLFYTEKASGNVRLFANGVLQPNAVITFAVDSANERGLLGIAIDPNFNTNHYIYVYYTCAPGSAGCPSLENKVVRFVENNGAGSSPTTIFTSAQSAPNHVGGNIHFGPDGKLYVTIGENANPANSQDVTVKQGKIHRINPDGSIPSDNPVFTQTGALPSLYAMGLRNSFDFTFDPLTPGRIFASENGPGCDDEMNRIEARYNYGWRSGYACDDTNPSPLYNTIRPLWFLDDFSCCEAPTGIMVYTGSQIPQWTNHLFMANFNSGDLRHFYLNGSRTDVTATNIVQGVNANMDLITGPDGAFYYIEQGGVSPGSLKRIVGPSGTPPPCVISFSDVTATDYFYEPVRYLYCAGAISGYSDNTFRPYNNTTRGQVAKIVVLAEGWPGNTSGGPHFRDVPGSNPFYLYIETAYNRGIVSGYSCGSPGEPCPGLYFRWGSNVTRGQLCKIVVLAEGWPGNTSGGPHFSDVSPSNPFYLYIETAYNRGIITGYAGGTFRPGNSATRGQIARIVYNAVTAP
jgi:aldose sugar dehydrogenase